MIVRAVVNERDLREFVDYPWQLYTPSKYPGWVPPLRVTVIDALDRANNPFYASADRELFLAECDGRTVGRIAAIENRAHNAFYGDRVGFFGFFECADDVEVARQLFGAASEWLAARGLDTMRGPMNPSTNYECGLLVEGYAEPCTFMTAWNPPYYDALMGSCGLLGSQDLLGFWFTTDDRDALPPFVERQALRTLARGHITFRDLDPKNFAVEVETLWGIYNNAWENNWGFVPMSREEFFHTAKDMNQLLDPRFAFLASVDGVPAGFMLALPDYNEVLRKNPSGRLWPLGALRLLWGKRRTSGVRVLALGVAREFRSRSILALFTHEVRRRAKLYGKRGGEASWLLADNHLIVKPMRAMGAREWKRWRIYDKVLATPER